MSTSQHRETQSEQAIETSTSSPEPDGHRQLPNDNLIHPTDGIRAGKQDGPKAEHTESPLVAAGHTSAQPSPIHYLPDATPEDSIDSPIHIASHPTGQLSPGRGRSVSAANTCESHLGAAKTYSTPEGPTDHPSDASSGQLSSRPFDAMAAESWDAVPESHEPLDRDDWSSKYHSSQRARRPMSISQPEALARPQTEDTHTRHLYWGDRFRRFSLKDGQNRLHRPSTTQTDAGKSFGNHGFRSSQQPRESTEISIRSASPTPSQLAALGESHGMFGDVAPVHEMDVPDISDARESFVPDVPEPQGTPVPGLVSVDSWSSKEYNYKPRPGREDDLNVSLEVFERFASLAFVLPK